MAYQVEAAKQVDFNSIKVRLILLCYAIFNLRFCYFNSIKVRLILSIPTIWARYSVEFQFHKGSINTMLATTTEAKKVDFNSIKVRLIREGEMLIAQFTIFQFHKGSINTTFAEDWNIFITDFNSIKVRLILTTRTRESRQTSISIP